MYKQFFVIVELINVNDKIVLGDKKLLYGGTLLDNLYKGKLSLSEFHDFNYEYIYAELFKSEGKWYLRIGIQILTCHENVIYDKYVLGRCRSLCGAFEHENGFCSRHIKCSDEEKDILIEEAKRHINSINKKLTFKANNAKIFFDRNLELFHPNQLIFSDQIFSLDDKNDEIIYEIGGIFKNLNYKDMTISESYVIDDDNLY